ncbi:hypothetical protein JCM11641_005193 [Rhodosporidiobolus odoratus]
MVWRVQGTLNSESPEDDSLPPTSSHYLRPNRLYKVGRMGGVRAPSKPGSSKPGLASKARPYDFKIASLSISKEGLCEFETGGGDWQAEDDADLPDQRYPLSIRINKKLQLTRANGESVLMSAGESMTIENGDHFQEQSKGYWFRFQWTPINICFSSATVAQKKEYQSTAKLLGIKLAYKTFLSHHTHFLTRTAIPTHALLRASISCARIASPAFFRALTERGAAPERPQEPLPAHPGPPPVGASKEDQAAYDKTLTGWEKQLLALNADVGGDWERWWGYSWLEKDWEAAWPEEGEFPPEVASQAAEMDPKKWDRDEKRKGLFKGVLVISFRGSPAHEEADNSIVQTGGGSFFACPLLQQSPLPDSAIDLVNAIDGYKTDNAVAGASKLVFIAPLGSLDPDGEKDENTLAQLELLKDLQRLLKVGKLCQGAEIAIAIHRVDAGVLFGSDIPPTAGDATQTSGGSSSRRTQSARTQPSQPAFTQPAPPFPTGGVPGTHPESGQPAASGSGSGPGSGSMDVDQTPQSGSGSNEASQEGENDEAPSQPRKLKRRAKTGRSVFDDMLEEEVSISDSRREETHKSSRLYTQEAGRSVASTSSAGARMDAEPATPANPPAPSRTTTLKRRAGQPNVIASMFGEDDSPDKGTSSGTQSTHEQLMRTKKTRQERMAAIEEEDRLLAQQELEQSQSAATAGKKGKGREVGAAEEDEEENAGRRKRDKSAAIGSGDSDEDRQPARKRTSKKEGAAPVSKTQKRSREMSRDLGASTSSSEDESARTSKKKSKTKEKTPPPPKNKKEAAAQKKAEKEAEEREAAKLLQMKTTKRKGAQADQAFNEDFNALKIVKPVIKSMPRMEKHRFGWEEEDSDVERDRMIREDQRMGEEEDEDMDPEHWRRPTQAMFVIKTLEVDKKERPPPRTDGVVDARWEGRLNFKKFRPKNAKGPREPLSQRPQIQLVVPESQDFGLGTGYNDRKGTAFSQVQQADDEDDEEDLVRTMTNSKGRAKLTFGAKSKPKAKAPAKKPAAPSKGKGKAKQVVVDSEDEDQLESDDDPRSSHTVRADDMDVGDDETPGSSARKPAVAKKGARAPRKAAPTTLIVDDSDSDSDSGLTFRGFGKKGASSGRARR